MMEETFRMFSEEAKTGITHQYSKAYRTSEKNLRNKLRARNWTDSEIDSHRQWSDEAHGFHYSSAYAFIMGLFAKYFLLSLKHASNEISRAILTKIIMNSLNLFADLYKYKSIKAKFLSHSATLCILD
jgi:hypothetical protein